MAYRQRYNSEFGDLGAEVAAKWPERAIIKRKGKKIDTLGLALSGGGYRSAIFNYGVLKGLHEIGVLKQFDYLSVVSGGSWIGTAFSTSDDLTWFFHSIPDHSNLIEEGFESLLANPLRVAQELALSRKTPNYVSNVYGRLLVRTFLREHGQAARHRALSDGMLKEHDRPFLIINGTLNYREPESFTITQECFEMTRLYCGSRSAGYVSTKDLPALEKPLRVRDAIAISGAAVAVHLPALGGEVAGIGLGREVVNYTRGKKTPTPFDQDTDRLDVADGGHYNNLGVESLISRGCGYIVIVDAEHDPEDEDKDRASSNQKYSGLMTLLKRNHIRQPFGRNVKQLKKILNRPDEPVHVFEGSDTIPDILYIKLKSSTAFDEEAAGRAYNRQGFLGRVFGGSFRFDPQFSTAKLDYDFAEHRNLSELGTFIVKQAKAKIKAFVRRST